MDAVRRLAVVPEALLLFSCLLIEGDHDMLHDPSEDKCPWEIPSMGTGHFRSGHGCLFFLVKMPSCLRQTLAQNDLFVNPALNLPEWLLDTQKNEADHVLRSCSQS